MDKCLTVQYNNIIKTFNIYNYDTLGSIFEHIMNKFNLYIYSLETIKCIICNSENDELKTIDFKTEYDNFNISLSDCITEDNCNVKFIMFDRDRDENGNVIKNNNFIDKYNTFLALVNDQSMARNLQNQYDRYIKYNNILNNLSNSRTSLSNSLLNMFIPLPTTYNTNPQQPTQNEEQLPTQNEEQLPTQNEEQLPTQNEEQLPTQNEEQLPTQNEEQLPTQNEEQEQPQTEENPQIDLFGSIPTENASNSEQRYTVNSSNIYDASGNPQLTYEFTINSIFPNQRYNTPNYRNLFQYATSNPSQFTFRTANSSGSSVGSSNLIIIKL